MKSLPLLLKSLSRTLAFFGLGLASMGSLSASAADKSEWSYAIDLSQKPSSPSWKFFEDTWAVTSSPAGRLLTPLVENPKAILHRLPRNLQPPVALDFQVLVYANKTVANRFRVSFYSDTGENARVYSAEIQPGGTSKLVRSGGGEVNLGKESPKIEFPESKLSASAKSDLHPVKGRLLWAKDRTLQLFIEDQLVTASDGPIVEPVNIIAVSVWNRVFENDPANQVPFRSLVVSVPQAAPAR